MTTSWVKALGLEEDQLTFNIEPMVEQNPSSRPQKIQDSLFDKLQNIKV